MIVAVERYDAKEFGSMIPLTECYLDNNYLAVPFTCNTSGNSHVHGCPRVAVNGLLLVPTAVLPVI